MRPEFTTERLHLRQWRLDDLETFVAMDMDADVGRYLYPHGRPTADARRQVMRQRMEDDWPDTGGFWTVTWHDSQEPLGWCGLFPLEDSGLIEIGYRYVTSTWGKGVATEAAARMLEHGFQDLEIDPIVAVTHPENIGSQKVLTKIGLQPGGLQFHYGLDLSFFSLDRATYLTSR